MAKKSFNLNERIQQSNPALPFISSAPTGEISETKSKRVQLLIRPSLYAKLKAGADRERRSLNDYVNIILEDYTKGD